MQRRLKGQDFAESQELVGGAGSSLEVCKEYELGQVRGAESRAGEAEPGFYLEPKYDREDRDAWRYYDPIRKDPGLFFEFARLREKMRREQAQPSEIALDWANKYGLLGCSREFYQNRRTFETQAASHEFVAHFFEEVDRAAGILAFYQASLNQDEDAILPLVRQYRPWTEDLFVRYIASDDSELYGGRLGFALYLVTSEVVRMVHTFAFPKLTLHPAGPTTPPGLSSGYGYLTLLGAMYLQMYWLVAAGEKHVAYCRQCGDLILLTARAPGPEGRPRKPRRDRRYCGDACRQRYHYRNATKPKREAERSQQQ